MNAHMYYIQSIKNLLLKQVKTQIVNLFHVDMLQKLTTISCAIQR